MKKKWIALGIALLVLIAGCNIAKTIYKNNQAENAFLLNVVLQGEYKVGESQWQPIVKGEHIPASQGEVVLRGTLQMAFPDGEIVAPVEQEGLVAMYFDHIGCSVYKNAEVVHVFESEDEQLGNASCGKHWIVYRHLGTANETIEIHLTNPHKYGNELAVDEFLNSMMMYDDMYFEYAISEETENLKIMGYSIVFVSMIIIGIALFSSLIHLDVSTIIWFAGATIFFAGVYFAADAANAFIWSENTSLKTTIIVLSIMLYGFFIEAITSVCFVKPYKKVGEAVVAVSGVFTGSLLFYAFVSHTKLFDVLAWWVVGQVLIIAALVFISCANVKYLKGLKRLAQIMFIVSLAAMLVDMAATRYGVWQGGYCSSIVFTVEFSAALFAVLRVFPRSIRAALREKEMQAELEKSKTSVMLSQIQPHFLYNSLGAIRELCRQDPEDARNALGTFITYLRGNMESIQREHTVHFSKELDHISAYLKLEKLRFGDDLDIVYDIQETDFFIPSLTIQPLVENAVKHGICGREDGGTVTLHTHREGEAVVIKIQDDGVGFDVSNLETLEHVGLKNVRNRLKYIVNGRLDIESRLDFGTTVTITIDDGKDWKR